MGSTIMYGHKMGFIGGWISLPQRVKPLCLTPIPVGEPTCHEGARRCALATQYMLATDACNPRSSSLIVPPASPCQSTRHAGRCAMRSTLRSWGRLRATPQTDRWSTSGAARYSEHEMAISASGVGETLCRRSRQQRASRGHAIPLFDRFVLRECRRWCRLRRWFELMNTVRSACS